MLCKIYKCKKNGRIISKLYEFDYNFKAGDVWSVLKQMAKACLQDPEEIVHMRQCGKRSICISKCIWYKNGYTTFYKVIFQKHICTIKSLYENWLFTREEAAI